MSYVIFIAVALGALFTIASIFQVAVELARLRVMLQTYLRIEPVKQDDKYKYRRKVDSFEDSI